MIDRVNVLFLAEAGHQPFARLGEARLPAVAGNTFKGMACGIEVSADETGVSVFADGGYNASAPRCRIGPGKGRIGNFGKIGRGYGIADGRII